MTLISKGKYYKKFDDVHKKIQILAFTRNMSFMHFQLHGSFWIENISTDIWCSEQFSFKQNKIADTVNDKCPASTELKIIETEIFCKFKSISLVSLGWIGLNIIKIDL